MREHEQSLPTILVILGATGHLMATKLASSLFRLWEKGLLPPLFQVVGFAKDDLTEEQFRDMVKDMVNGKAEASSLERFSKIFVYRKGFFEEEEGYKQLAGSLGMKDKEWQVCSNKLFYIAASPQFYETIFRKLESSGLTKPCSPEEGWTRVIVEKPFGKDLKTAENLDRLFGKLFREEQIYRMDHYLGKETVQNILAFRFSNSFLEPAWNKEGIERVRVRLLEREGVGGRGAFYEGMGALRDVGQNHILQMLALFTMDRPQEFAADDIRKRKAEILETLPRFSDKDVERWTLRGQYEKYRKEKDVDPGSETETYFRIRTFLNHPNWKGVPVELESGKGLGENLVEVEITFRHLTPCLCPDKNNHYRNVLYYHVAPTEKVEISLWAKKPGTEMALEEKEFSFDYRQAFVDSEVDAYEKLLLNAVQGDQTSFVSTEEIAAEWKFVDPILVAWEKNAAPLVFYQGKEILERPL